MFLKNKVWEKKKKVRTGEKAHIVAVNLPHKLQM